MTGSSMLPQAVTLAGAVLLAAVVVVIVVRAAKATGDATRHDPLGIDLGTTHYQQVVDSVDPTGAEPINGVSDSGGMTLQELAELR